MSFEKNEKRKKNLESNLEKKKQTQNQATKSWLHSS